MNLITLIKISRPRFWFYTAGPFFIGYIAGGDSTSVLYSWELLVGFIYFLIPINIMIYGINDIYDKETDHLNPKKHSYEKKYTINNVYIYAISLITSSIGIYGAILTNNIVLISFFLFFLFLTLFYSAPPFRFKNIPFADSLSNVLYTLPAIIGYLYTSNTLPPTYIYPILIAWPAAMHLFSAIPDIKVDRNAHIQTTAVYLGKTVSLHLCLFYWGIIPFILFFNKALSLGILSLIYPIIILYSYSKEPKEFFKIYMYMPYINITVGFLLFLYVLFT